jgi:hypothetical protein
MQAQRPHRGELATIRACPELVAGMGSHATTPIVPKATDYEDYCKYVSSQLVAFANGTGQIGFQYTVQAAQHVHMRMCAFVLMAAPDRLTASKWVCGSRYELCLIRRWVARRRLNLLCSSAHEHGRGVK